jgi:UDP-N-acetylmuramoyl-tripeptide--D-alanyl-D-alanine ligase
MDHFGEIDRTSKVATPDIACIMNIGICHIEYLKTQENIMRAKFEILNHMKPNSLVILNGDDKLLSSVYTNKEVEDCKHTLLDKEVVYIGTNSDCDCVAKNINVDYEKNEVHATLKYLDSTLDVKIPGVSIHLIYPTLAAFVIACKLNMDVKNFEKGLQMYSRTPMRMEVMNVSESITVVDDTYNANPDSMKSLINAISNWNKKNKICILGPMRELGNKEKTSHEEIGKYVLNSKLTSCIFIGDIMEYAYNIAKQSNNLDVRYFATKEKAYEYLKTMNLEDVVFGLKASRYYKFEEITDFLKQMYKNE